jgi:hypothetical protein
MPTKISQNKSNAHTVVYQMVIKDIKIIHSKALQNVPKLLGFGLKIPKASGSPVAGHFCNAF